MAVRTPPRTISAEPVKGGVIIAFSNGDEGFFSDELLYRLLPSAQELLAQVLGERDDSEPPH